jgi:uncharacterized membrane protein (DUF4010 family)
MPDSPLLAYAELEAISLALALGLLVGVQRGWATRKEPAGSRFAGIRTFGLLGLAGGIAGAVQPRAAALATVLLAASAILILIGYWRATATRNAISGTASIAALLSLACGYMAGTGAFALAAAASGTMVLVLALRSPLHRWLDRQLWLVVVLVSGFSFLGYFAARQLGPARGILATAAAGSMVSSTAVTASLAAKLRDGEGDPALLNAGIALASAVMFVRVMVLTAALARFALPTLALFAVPGMLASLAAFAWLMRRRQPVETAASTMPLRNPFALGPALWMMLLVMVMTVLARWVLARFGDSGLAAVLAITGAADVDSAIITMGNLPPSTLAPKLAGLVLLSPILLNTLFKAVTAVSIAGWSKAKGGAAALAIAAVVAALGVPLAL